MFCAQGTTRRKERVQPCSARRPWRRDPHAARRITLLIGRTAAHGKRRSCCAPCGTPTRRRSHLYPRLDNLGGDVLALHLGCELGHLLGLLGRGLGGREGRLLERPERCVHLRVLAAVQEVHDRALGRCGTRRRRPSALLRRAGGRDVREDPGPLPRAARPNGRESWPSTFAALLRSSSRAPRRARGLGASGHAPVLMCCQAPADAAALTVVCCAALVARGTCASITRRGCGLGLALDRHQELALSSHDHTTAHQAPQRHLGEDHAAPAAAHHGLR